MADATLKAEIVGLNRSPARSVRGNVLSTTEFNLTMTVKYTLLGRDGKTLGGGAVSGGTERANARLHLNDLTEDEPKIVNIVHKVDENRATAELASPGNVEIVIRFFQEP